MAIIYDHKDRQHTLEGVDGQFTYLQCIRTKARIKVANASFAPSGFRAER